VSHKPGRARAGASGLVTFPGSGYVFRKPMRVAPVVALALFMVACGPAQEMSSTGAEPTIVNVPPGELTTEIVGATPEQKEILLDALSRVGDQRLERITVKEAQPGWGDRGEVGLEFTPRPQAAKDIRASWEVLLIGDAFAIHSRDLGLPSVVYVGAPGVGQVTTGEPVRRGTEEGVTAFVTRLEKAAERAGVKVREIEVLTPVGFAVAVTVVVPDPANFLDQRANDFFDRLGEQQPDVDIRFVDSKGSPISEGWSAGSTGSVWTRSDLAGCSPYLVSQPVTYDSPPCPIEAGPDIEFVPPTEVTPKIAGGSEVQQSVIHQILAGLGHTRIDSVEVATDIDKAWRAPPGAVGIDVRSAKPDGFTDWQARTLVSVFGRRSLELGLPEVWYIGVNGDQAGGMDFSRDRKEARMTRDEAERALHEVVEIAKRHEASTRARVFEPSRLAFAVEFRAANPAAFLRSGLMPALAPIDAETHDGLYVEVLDVDGERVLEVGSGVWVRPDLVSCSPYGYYGSPDMPEQPPCPAK
jgi:hypothetical protein